MDSSRRETGGFDETSSKLGSRLFTGARRRFHQRIHSAHRRACGWLSRVCGGDGLFRRRSFSARGATSLAVMLRSPSLLPGRCEIAERVALQPSHVRFAATLTARGVHGTSRAIAACRLDTGVVRQNGPATRTPRQIPSNPPETARQNEPPVGTLAVKSVKSALVLCPPQGRCTVRMLYAICDKTSI